MNCPVCNDVRMREVEKDGIMIDICPECKGVWLDRGELEKLLREVREQRDDYNRWYDDNRRPPQGRGDDDRPYKGDDHHYPKHHKKKGVLDRLGDLFD